MLSIIHYLHEGCEGDDARKRGYWHGYCALIQHAARMPGASINYAINRLSECRDEHVAPWADAAPAGSEGIYRCAYRDAYTVATEHLANLAVDGKRLSAIVETLDTYTLTALYEWCQDRAKRQMPPPEPKAIQALRRRHRK